MARDYALSMNKPVKSSDRLSNAWFYDFLKSCSDLKIVTPKILSLARAKCVSKETLASYFRELGTPLTTNNLKDHLEKTLKYTVDSRYLDLAYLEVKIWSLFKHENLTTGNKILCEKKVREKSRECHNHKTQPFPDTKRKRKPTNPNKHKSNKRTKSTKISILFPERGNSNAKRIEKHKN